MDDEFEEEFDPTSPTGRKMTDEEIDAWCLQEFRLNNQIYEEMKKRQAQKMENS